MHANDAPTYQHQELTESIIRLFYKVYNALGYGFLEKIYEKAMMLELEKAGIPAVAQSPIRVTYEGKIIGEYFADILVDSKVIIEIKAARKLAEEHEAQLLNYLKATDIEVGLLLNFGPRPEIKRRAYDSTKKR